MAYLLAFILKIDGTPYPYSVFIQLNGLCASPAPSKTPRMKFKSFFPKNSWTMSALDDHKSIRHIRSEPSVICEKFPLPRSWYTSIGSEPPCLKRPTCNLSKVDPNLHELRKTKPVTVHYSFWQVSIRRPLNLSVSEWVTPRTTARNIARLYVIPFVIDRPRRPHMLIFFPPATPSDTPVV